MSQQQPDEVATKPMTLVERLRDTPNWQRQSFGPWKTATNVYDRAPFEAADELERLQVAQQARPLSDWDEDMGSVLWWRFPIDEPPYCGTPNCDNWPGYHTHWTPLVIPSDPAPVSESSSEGGES